MSIRAFAATVIGFLVSLLSTSVWADPPGRVGRLSVHAGAVYIAASGAEWRAVAHNYPITHGDNVHVAPGGRAEIDFGSGSAWLAGGSTVFFDRLDDSHFRARLGEGQLIVRLRELDRGETANIELPRGTVDLTTPGLYRFESGAVSGARGGDMVHVKFGSAELSSGGAFEPLRGGDAVELDGARIGFLNIRGDDAFGLWADGRDRRYEGQRYAYVSPYMVGARDLEEHGAWRENGSYGWVWYPRRVANDWAPYRFGHWTFVAPWGWTWVDDAPWGFAPFHYGRWVHLNGRWGWTPGPWERRPVYSPALVAWHGNFGGTSINVNVGNSTVYWTPLSWGEAYYPSYTVSANFWRVINRHHVHHTAVYSPAPPRGTNYRNWYAPGGATAVEASVIASARPVAPAIRAMGPLPTTAQVEAVSMYDRVKPAYAGAPTRTMQGGQIIAPAPVARTAPSPQSAVVEAGVVRTMPPAAVQQQHVPQGGVQQQPGRVTPQPQPQQPVYQAPQTAVSGAPVRAMPSQPAAAVREPGLVNPQPTMQPHSPMQPNSPMQPQRSTQMPPAVPSAQPQPLPQQRPLPPADTRRVMPTQARGEAQPERPVQPFVEPQPRQPRAVAPQPVAPAQPAQDRSRRGEDKPDREKPQR